MGACERPRIRPCGETAVSVELGEIIDRSLNERVHGLCRRIKSLEVQGIVDLNPTYRSLLIQYDPWLCSYERLLLVIDECLDLPSDGEKTSPELIEIPVCYGGHFGPDLVTVADFLGLTPAQVVELHAAPVYHVYMIGFTPGFPYLGGLDERLFIPRRKEPRSIVPAGSVGIADRQTGVYPVETPGGWHLIGRTPLKLLDLDRPRPFLLSPGCRVRFQPIAGEAFESTQGP